MGVETSSDQNGLVSFTLTFAFCKKSFKSKWVKLKTLSLSSTRPTKATMLMPSTWATSSAPWGVKRIAFADFGAILTAVKADTSSTGVKEDYIEGFRQGRHRQSPPPRG